MNLRSAISSDELKRLYLDEALTIDEIAARFSLSHTSVRRRMRELVVILQLKPTASATEPATAQPVPGGPAGWVSTGGVKIEGKNQVPLA